MGVMDMATVREIMAGREVTVAGFLISEY